MMGFMKIIGLTGGSGAGKNTVCEIIQKKYKAKVIDADKIAKNLQKKGSMYLNSIIDNFGADIVYKNGELNRKKLANIIYEDDKKREQLNELTFIYVVDEIKKKINKIKEELIIINAPLLYESNLNQICDYVIAVISDEESRIERICKRDGTTKKEAKKRIAAQNTDEFFIENSDYIIYNQKDMKDLEKQIEKIKI